MLSADTWLKIICAMQVNAVIFGVGAVLVLALPSLSAHAMILIPAVVAMSFVLAPFVAFPIARRMRLRNWGRDAWKKGDLISG